VTKWSLPVESATKSTSNWTCDWTTADDAKLIVGVWRYGHGNWDEIHKDSTLKLGGKFFLEETKKGETKDNKSLPNAIHLSRRTDYLTGLLFSDANESGQNDVKPPRTKSPRTKPKAKPKSESTVSSTVKKPSSTKSAAPNKKSSNGGSKASSKIKPTPTYTSSEPESESELESMDESQCKEDLRPVKKELKRLSAGTEGMDREEKVLLYKECLTKVGQEIQTAAMKEQSEQSRAKKTMHLCTKLLPKFCSRTHNFLLSRRGLVGSFLAHSSQLEISQRFVRLFPPHFFGLR
jgi:chromodomain-helicase-DNA-binding protein 1